MWQIGAALRAAPIFIELLQRLFHQPRQTLGKGARIRRLGWEPSRRFQQGLEQTVEWYRDNEWWWEPIRSGDYRAYYERQYGRALG